MNPLTRPPGAQCRGDQNPPSNQRSHQNAPDPGKKPDHAAQRGLFVVLEGPDGGGKSTQVDLLVRRWRSGGATVHQTFEPGGTDLGREIRSLVLHADSEPMAEALLMTAQRVQHVAALEPLLAAGSHVVTDRYLPSSLVYQGLARGLGVDRVLALHDLSGISLEPDVVFVLDPGDRSLRDRPDADRFESAGAEFGQRVRDGYRHLATRFGWQMIDASGSIDEVADQLWGVLADFGGDAVEPRSG
ncbi:MAG: dTMP kinase [Actinobacteria bacterium]|nr:dTMP kinase [Actinomycetota bacterium]MCB9389767.1 dTMP kinase [Acidimicrobiia bacterium]